MPQYSKKVDAFNRGYMGKDFQNLNADRHQNWNMFNR